MKTVKNTIFRGVNPFEDYPFDSTLVDYQGWGSDHPILTTLIDILRPKLILEVGTWKGLSAIYMANCIKSLNLETEIVCIDTWLGSPEHWLPKNGEVDYYKSLSIHNGHPNLYNTFMANVISQSVQDIITPFPINSDSAFVVLSNLNVQAELIYIDAGHEYDCVLRDIQNYWKLLTNDGCMVLDDFNSWPGVTQAVMEFCALNKLVPLTDDRKAVIFKSKPTSLRNLINYQP